MATNHETVAATHKMMKDMIAGIPKLPAGVTSVTVLGTTYALSDLTTKLSGFATVYDGVDAAELAHSTALSARTAIEPQVDEFMAGVIAAMKAALGKKSPTLELVGLSPDKTPAPLTLAQEQAKAAKAKATRAARHTMSAKAKAKIKGTPPATPPATPAA